MMLVTDHLAAEKSYCGDMPVQDWSRSHCPLPDNCEYSRIFCWQQQNGAILCLEFSNKTGAGILEVLHYFPVAHPYGIE